MSELVLYGIPNCDTVKKARRWLAEQGIDYRFHNFKKDGLDDALLQRWLPHFGVETLINRRGTTWRKLAPEQQATLQHNSAETRALLQDQTSLLKRPLLTVGEHTLLGFEPERWSEQLKR